MFPKYVHAQCTISTIQETGELGIMGIFQVLAENVTICGQDCTVLIDAPGRETDGQPETYIVPQFYLDEGEDVVPVDYSPPRN